MANSLGLPSRLPSPGTLLPFHRANNQAIRYPLPDYIGYAVGDCGIRLTTDPVEVGYLRDRSVADDASRWCRVRVFIRSVEHAGHVRNQTTESSTVGGPVPKFRAV